MSMRDESYYRACCCHVHTCTAFISGFMVICGLATSIGIAFSDAPAVRYTGLIGFIISFVSYIFLFIGNRKKIHVLYYPYIILQLLFLLFLAVIIVLSILVMTHVIKPEETPKHTDTAGSVGELIWAILYTMVTFYFFHVVYRDFKYVRDEV